MSLWNHINPQTPNMTVSPIPWSIPTQCTYIMSRYSVALLFPANSSNSSVSGLRCCVAGLTKPTWKDSRRHNHFTSSASSSALWSCCAVDHYSMETHCCLALCSVSVLFVDTASISTVASATMRSRCVSVIVLSLACFYLIRSWLCFCCETWGHYLPPLFPKPP